MSRSIFLTLQIDPIRTTAQSAGRIVRTKDGRMFIAKFQKGSLRRFEAEIIMKIHQYMSIHYPGFQKPDRSTPVNAWIEFSFPPLKERKPRLKPIPKTTRPDLDNMAKSVIDCLTRSGLLADDSQITTLTLTKRIHHQAGFISFHLIYS